MMVSRPHAALAVLISLAAVALTTRGQAFTAVDLEGRTMRMLVQGSGAATVVFENGLGAPLETWGKVRPAVSTFATTVSYDRISRDGRRVARELRRALQLAKLPPPYVLVGGSLGGQYVRVYAGLYPEDVAAMVLVDPTPDSERREAIGSPVPDVPVFLIRAEGVPEVPFTTESIRAARRTVRREIAVESLEHKAWIERVPKGRLIVTRESGHNVPIEQPDLVVETIRRAVTGGATLSEMRGGR